MKETTSYSVIIAEGYRSAAEDSMCKLADEETIEYQEKLTKAARKIKLIIRILTFMVENKKYAGYFQRTSL